MTQNHHTEVTSNVPYSVGEKATAHRSPAHSGEGIVDTRAWTVGWGPLQPVPASVQVGSLFSSTTSPYVYVWNVHNKKMNHFFLRISEFPITSEFLDKLLWLFAFVFLGIPVSSRSTFTQNYGNEFSRDTCPKTFTRTWHNSHRF